MRTLGSWRYVNMSIGYDSRSIFNLLISAISWLCLSVLIWKCSVLILCAFGIMSKCAYAHRMYQQITSGFGHIIPQSDCNLYLSAFLKFRAVVLLAWWLTVRKRSLGRFRSLPFFPNVPSCFFVVERAQDRRDGNAGVDNIRRTLFINYFHLSPPRQCISCGGFTLQHAQFVNCADYCFESEVKRHTQSDCNLYLSAFLKFRAVVLLAWWSRMRKRSLGRFQWLPFFLTVPPAAFL